MALLGNILWFIFGGWWSFLLYALLGTLFYITIIGIPIGKALFQYAKLMALPFGKVIIRETELKGKENVSSIRRVGGVIANILWLPVGVAMFIVNIGAMIVCAVTIIGIPIAVVIARSSKFLLWPIGAKVITKDQAETLKMERTMKGVMQNTGTPGNAAAYDQTMQIQQSQPQTISAVQTSDPYIMETGGKTVPTIAETGGKVVSTIASKGSAGVSALSTRQKMIKEEILARQADVTTEDLLIQAEAKLYRNSVMEWVMPFLEYITLAIGVISVVLGVIWLGVLQGINTVAPLMIIAALLGVIKRNKIFVIAVLGVQLMVHLISLISLLNLARQGIYIGASVFFNIIWILCYIGVIAVYIYPFIVKNRAGQKQTMTSDGVSASKTTIQAASGTASPGAIRFCSQCGAKITEGITFCGTCGTKVE